MSLKKKMAADFGCGQSEWNTYFSKVVYTVF